MLCGRYCVDNQTWQAQLDICPATPRPDTKTWSPCVCSGQVCCVEDGRGVAQAYHACSAAAMGADNVLLKFACAVMCGVQPLHLLHTHIDHPDPLVCHRRVHEGCQRHRMLCSVSPLMLCPHLDRALCDVPAEPDRQRTPDATGSLFVRAPCGSKAGVSPLILRPDLARAFCDFPQGLLQTLNPLLQLLLP